MNLWQTKRNLYRVQLDNHVPGCTYRYEALPDTDSWSIVIRNECEGPYGTTVASVRMRKLTPTVWLSEKLYVDEKYRGKGISKKLFNVQKQFLLELDGGVLQAFVTDSNHVQVHRLQSLGWIRGTSYTDEDCLEAHVWFYSPFGFVGP